MVARLTPATSPNARPKGWAEHASFWISAFLGALIVAGAATVDIIRDLEPFGLLVILALGLYGIWSGWSGGRHGYSLKDRMLLVQGEAMTAAALVAAAVIAARGLSG